jgi:hypothetical protein
MSFHQEIIVAKEPKKLEDLFHDTLKDIYFAEKKILVTLNISACGAGRYRRIGIPWCRQTRSP